MYLKDYQVCRDAREGLVKYFITLVLLHVNYETLLMDYYGGNAVITNMCNVSLLNCQCTRRYHQSLEYKTPYEVHFGVPYENE